MMSDMRRRGLPWAVIAAAAAASATLVVFWKARGLEQAGWLAGVLSAFAALAALVIALPPHTTASVPSAPPEPEESNAQASGGAAVHTATTTNRFSGGTNIGPLIMGRNFTGPVTYGSPFAKLTSLSTTAALTPEVAEDDGESVSNVFSGGMNQGPLVMGRNIVGPVASGTVSPPGAAAPLQASDESSDSAPEEEIEEASGERSGEQMAGDERH